VFAKLGKVSVRKSVIKLFNKFSPMTADVVEQGPVPRQLVVVVLFLFF